MLRNPQSVMPKLRERTLQIQWSELLQFLHMPALHKLPLVPWVNKGQLCRLFLHQAFCKHWIIYKLGGGVQRSLCAYFHLGCRPPK